MAVPPEVAFSRYFQTRFPYVPPVRPEDPDPRPYRGRHDLSSLPPALREQLRGIQATFNDALLNEKRDVPEHVDHPMSRVQAEETKIARQHAGVHRHADLCRD